MNETLGQIHFWGSLVFMNGIFMPMFIQGLAGVSRRLYDGGASYLHAQHVLVLNKVMSHSAWALGVVQLVFIVNFFWSLLRDARSDDNPWEATTLEWATPTPPPHGNFPTGPRGAIAVPTSTACPGREGRFYSAVQTRPGRQEPGGEMMSAAIEIPYNSVERPDTGLYNAKLGVWLFLASEVMLFGALFSSYVLLRTGRRPGSTARTF